MKRDWDEVLTISFRRIFKMKLKNVIRKTATLGLALAFTVTGSGCGTESAKGEATTVEAAETARVLQAV